MIFFAYASPIWVVPATDRRCAVQVNFGGCCSTLMRRNSANRIAANKNAKRKEYRREDMRGLDHGLNQRECRRGLMSNV